MFADPARRKHVVRAQAHLLSGIATCPKCGGGGCITGGTRRTAGGSVRVRGRPVRMRPHRDQGRAAGGIRDRRGAGCAGIPARARGAARCGHDPPAPRRAELLAEIKRAQDVRDEARRDLAGGVIDRVDWLDIRQRTEDAISAARREYDRLSGSATVMSDIPPSERVRDAWESWSTDRKRAAIRAVLHRVIINPPPAGLPSSPAGNSRTRPSAANAKWRSCGSASNSTGACSNHAAHTSGGDEPGDRLRRFVLMPLVCSCGVFFRCAAARGQHARARRAPRPLPGPQFAPGNRARPGSVAHRPRRPAGSRRAPGR